MNKTLDEYKEGGEGFVDIKILDKLQEKYDALEIKHGNLEYHEQNRMKLMKEDKTRPVDFS